MNFIIKNTKSLRINEPLGKPLGRIQSLRNHSLASSNPFSPKGSNLLNGKQWNKSRFYSEELNDKPNEKKAQITLTKRDLKGKEAGKEEEWKAPAESFIGRGLNKLEEKTKKGTWLGDQLESASKDISQRVSHRADSLYESALDLSIDKLAETLQTTAATLKKNGFKNANLESTISIANVSLTVKVEMKDIVQGIPEKKLTKKGLSKNKVVQEQEAEKDDK